VAIGGAAFSFDLFFLQENAVELAGGGFDFIEIKARPANSTAFS